MKKVTFKVDDETHRKARLRAEADGPTVVGLVRNILESLTSGTGARDEICQAPVARPDDRRSEALEVVTTKPQAAPEQDEPDAGHPRGRKV